MAGIALAVLGTATGLVADSSVNALLAALAVAAGLILITAARRRE